MRSGSTLQWHQQIAHVDDGLDLDSEGSQFHTAASKQVPHWPHDHIHRSLLKAPEHLLPALIDALASHGRQNDLIGTIVGIVFEQCFNHIHLTRTEQLLFKDLFASQERKNALVTV